MPPERQPTQKRRTLPFKPPSRAGSSATAAGPSTSKPAAKTKKTPKTTTASSSKATSKSTSKPKPKTTKASSSRQKPSPSPSATNSDADSDSNSNARSPDASGSESDGNGEADGASEANYILAEISHGDAASEDVLSSDPLIPPKLLTKLVHHHFKNPKTKIAKDANEVVAKYIDVFVREAVARSAFERAEGGAAGGGSAADGFLEVEDLEKMGPQLAMDF